MSDFENKDPPFIRRRPAVAVAATVILAAGIAFSVQGGTSSGNYIEKKTEVVVCTATGGLAKYAYCNWQEPVSDSGSGSAITGIFYSVGHGPVVVGVDFTTGPSATVSGSVILNNIQTNSGAVAYLLSGAYMINSGAYLRGVTLADPGVGHTASLMIEYITRLSK